MCYSFLSFHADSSKIQTNPCIRYTFTRSNTKPTTPALQLRHFNDMPHATPGQGRHDLRDTPREYAVHTHAE